MTRIASQRGQSQAWFIHNPKHIHIHKHKHKKLLSFRVVVLISIVGTGNAEAQELDSSAPAYVAGISEVKFGINSTILYMRMSPVPVLVLILHLKHGEVESRLLQKN